MILNLRDWGDVAVSGVMGQVPSAWINDLQSHRLADFTYEVSV